MAVTFEIRYACHPEDAKHYDTEKIRKEFLISNLMIPDTIKMVYTLNDRFIIGGAVPLSEVLELESIDPLKSTYFLERREIGIINVGGKGIIEVDNESYILDTRDALYIGMGYRKINFRSDNKDQPAHFYFNSAPAHKAYPVRKVSLEDAQKTELGSLESSNARRINKLLVTSIIETCQLQMGMTELQPGSVWNTMPPHTHSRRMEAYFYFNLPEGHAVCHFMGEPKETRHIWMKNEEAVISPPWSVHAAAGTSNYHFIWGMAGENLDYGDMDTIRPDELR